eukprot:76476_1
MYLVMMVYRSHHIHLDVVGKDAGGIGLRVGAINVGVGVLSVCVYYYYYIIIIINITIIIFLFLFSNFIIGFDGDVDIPPASSPPHHPPRNHSHQYDQLYILEYKTKQK